MAWSFDEGLLGLLRDKSRIIGQIYEELMTTELKKLYIPEDSNAGAFERIQ